MADGILYLDIDDEITSAATRIRSVEGRRVAVVLPYGSRVATSRINFRLLARDALTHEKRLSIVAGDAAARALAASAGLPVFSSVAEYETSLGTEGAVADLPPERSTAAQSPSDDVAGEDGPSAGTRAAAAMAASLAAAPDDRASSTSTAPVTRGSPGGTRPSAPAQPQEPLSSSGSPGAVAPDRRPAGTVPTMPVTTGRRGPRIGRGAIVVGVLVLALAVVVGGVAAYLYLPSATAVITPREQTIGPVSLRITASTAIDAPDIAAGQVPAELVSVPVMAQDTFAATGTRVEETKAKGEVQFQNFDPTSSNTVAKGAIVSTNSGVRFRTSAAITVPAAELVGVTIFPAAKSANVTAVDPGEDGNVGANTIVEVPRGENPVFLRVTNPEATSGGTRKEFPRVTQEDVDGAMAALTTQLQTSFEEQIADPSFVTGDATVFPETAVLGDATPTAEPDSLVGQEVESFDLGLGATGTVTTVDGAPVRDIAEARLLASKWPGYQFVDGSSEITESPAVVDGDTITYPVVATARQIWILDPTELKAAIIGKTVADARTYLEGFGDVQLDVWPDWVGTIPTFDSRVEVTVNGPIRGDSATPSTTPSGGPTPGSTP